MVLKLKEPLCLNNIYTKWRCLTGYKDCFFLLYTIFMRSFIQSSCIHITDLYICQKQEVDFLCSVSSKATLGGSGGRSRVCMPNTSLNTQANSCKNICMFFFIKCLKQELHLTSITAYGTASNFFFSLPQEDHLCRDRMAFIFIFENIFKNISYILVSELP